MKQQTQKKKLDGLIRDLERELTEGKSQVAALEETHRRLQESERICQELADENRRLGQEIKGWQGRLSESEEYERQLGMLRQQFDVLHAEHARLVEENRQMEEKLSAATAAASALPLSSPREAAPDTVAKAMPAAEMAETALRTETANNQSHVPLPSVVMAKVSQLKLNWVIGNPRISLGIAGLFVLLIVGLVTLKGMMREEPLAPSPISFPQESLSIESIPEPAKVSAAKVTAKTAAPRVRGAFQTVTATSVFSGPSENTAIVANIGKGTKINVVDSSDGWLEIRSKHGRPPGFIRKEAAERMDERGTRGGREEKQSQ